MACHEWCGSRADVETLETRNGGELTVATTCPSGGALDIFIDPHLPKPLLVVIGESPAARTLGGTPARVVGFPNLRRASRRNAGGLSRCGSRAQQSRPQRADP